MEDQVLALGDIPALSESMAQALEDVAILSESLAEVDFVAVSSSLDELWTDYSLTSGSLDNVSSSLANDYYTKTESDINYFPLTGSHESLQGLLGGTTSEHYHLTENEHTTFQNISSSYFIPMWDDLVISAVAVNPPGSVGPAVINTTNSTLDFENGSTQRCDFVWQLPHGYMTGSAAEFHIHYKCSDANTGNVTWNYAYRWIEINGVIPAFTIGSISMPIPTPGASNKHYLFEIIGTGSLTGVGMGISSIIQVQLSRVGGTDTYNGNVQMLSADIHFQKDTNGSYQELVKRP